MRPKIPAGGRAFKEVEAAVTDATNSVIKGTTVASDAVPLDESASVRMVDKHIDSQDILTHMHLPI